jgi:hypothetical protein
LKPCPPRRPRTCGSAEAVRADLHGGLVQHGVGDGLWAPVETEDFGGLLVYQDSMTALPQKSRRRSSWTFQRYVSWSGSPV